MSSSAEPRRRPWLVAASALALVGALAGTWVLPSSLPWATAAPATEIAGTVHLPPAVQPRDVVVTLVAHGERGTSRTRTHLEADGRYRFPDLTGGDFRLEFGSVSGAVVPQTDESWRRATVRFSVQAGTEVVHDVRMVRPAAMAGTLQRPAGKRAARVGVSLQRADGQGGWRSVAHADVEGERYAFSGLLPGSYRVLAVPEDASLARTWSGGSTWEDEATVHELVPAQQAVLEPLRVSRGVALSGRVRLAGDLAPDQVRVVVNGRAPAATGADWEFSDFTWLRPDGTFRLVGLPVGEQRVSFWDEGGRLAELPVLEASSGDVVDDLTATLTR